MPYRSPRWTLTTPKALRTIALGCRVSSAATLGGGFGCTNANTVGTRIGVEVFGQAGTAVNDPSATSVDVPAGGSVRFGTNATGFLPIDSDLGAALFSKGAARVLATAKGGILCSAYLADTVNNPAGAVATLQVIKKTAQKGQ
jgi:hypothetical protein